MTNISRKKYIQEWQQKKRTNEARNPKGKIQCQICQLWYRKVGSHTWQVHKISAREYRKEYGFDVKRGQLPEKDREVIRNHTLKNGTIKNLENGKRFWFKKGDYGIGRYQRSKQTLERLSQLHKFNKKG